MVLITHQGVNDPALDQCFPVSITTDGKRRREDGKSPTAPSATITINPICRNKLLAGDSTCQDNTPR